MYSDSCEHINTVLSKLDYISSIKCAGPEHNAVDIPNGRLTGYPHIFPVGVGILLQAQINIRKFCRKVCQQKL